MPRKPPVQRAHRPHQRGDLDGPAYHARPSGRRGDVAPLLARAACAAL